VLNRADASFRNGKPNASRLLALAQAQAQLSEVEVVAEKAPSYPSWHKRPLFYDTKIYGLYTAWTRGHKPPLFRIRKIYELRGLAIPFDASRPDLANGSRKNLAINIP
jgi:hypothetical protein